MKLSKTMSEANTQLLSNTLALNLALQTIKERCVHLQKRLFALESENSQLRLNTLNNDKKNDSSHDNSLTEIEGLRAKNAELTLQKNQLTDNLTMISTENRKLWKRLSQLTKEESSPESSEPTAAAKNLIRSKTFTQNSPHQLLKDKLVGHQVGPDDDLEDVSLGCGFSADKMTFDQEEACDLDSKACTDGMLSIKKELMKQNSDLKVALSNWRKLKASATCSCEKKPQMVDKNSETDREVTLEYIDIEGDNTFEIAKHENVLIDLIEEKRAADMSNKVKVEF